MRGACSSLLLALALLACGTPLRDPTGMPPSATEEQRSEARRLLMLSIDDFVEQTIRTQRISQRIRAAGAQLCEGQASPVLGAAVLSVAQLPSVLQELAAERFGDRSSLHVVALFEGSPASEAGVRTGDELLELNGTRLKDASRLSRVRCPEGDSELLVRRDGVELALSMRSVPGCRFPAFARLTQERNAYIGRDEIFINSGLARSLNDSLLAYVIGHEIAHGILHPARSRIARGPDVETEADYLGAYLAVRGGFELIDSGLFEQLQRDLASLDRVRGRGHPPTYERALALRGTIAELRAKLDRGEPLTPELP